MLHVLGCITQQHDLRLVLLAAMLCAFGCWTAVSLASRARVSDGITRTVWLIAAGSVFGAGVWSTHFVAMLAYQSPVLVGYDIIMTAASIAVAMIASTAGFALVIRGATLTGGAVLGASVASMHFVGMTALHGAFVMQWDPVYIVASLIVSVGFAMAAAWTAARLKNTRGRVAAAGLLILGIVALHFTAMTAVTLVSNPTISPAGSDFPPDMLAIAIAAVSALIVALGLIAAVLDSHLALRRSDEEARLRAHIVELEETERSLEATSFDLRLALVKADEANKAKAAFLAAMSHELRTPLNAVIGFSELLLADKRNPVVHEKHREYISDIRNSGSHLLALINDVLDLTKLDAAQVTLQEERVSLEALIAEAIRMTAGQGDAGSVHLSSDIEAGLPDINADHRRLLQILLNLVTNAIKFTLPGGAVTIAAVRDADGVVLSVTDNGIGMAPDEIPRALERFGQIDTSLSRKYEGVGLGLPLAKQLAELHGGTLAIQSALNEGTTVRIHLPAFRLLTRQEKAA